MSSNRHLARIIALQTLYEYEFRTHAGIEDLHTDIQEILERNLAVYQDTMQETDFVRDLVEGTMANITTSDAQIEPAAPEWPIDQIAKMDLTILRLAIYELMIKREVPPKVVINEAVELAKSFGGENSSKFINGVLGTIYRQSEFYDPTEDHKVQRERGQHGSQPNATKAPEAQRSASSSKPTPQAAESASEPAERDTIASARSDSGSESTESETKPTVEEQSQSAASDEQSSPE